MRNSNLPTKKAKKIKVYYEEVICKVYRYQCPTCSINLSGAIGIHDNTLRFRCGCGQELIIESITKKDDPFRIGNKNE